MPYTLTAGCCTHAGWTFGQRREEKKIKTGHTGGKFQYTQRFVPLPFATWFYV